MAGLDVAFRRYVPLCRRITKDGEHSNLVFIGVSSHPLVWLLYRRRLRSTSFFVRRHKFSAHQANF